MPPYRRPAAPLLLLASVLALAGCGSGAGGDASDTSDTGGSPGDDRISIVTSTNVFGDIAARVGGQEVDVTSIVDGPSQDPHSYEATVQDKLTVSKADLVIDNGGGYDPFLARLAEDTDRSVLSAVTVSGLDGFGQDGGPDANEHVWYSLPAMENLAGAVADELARLDEPNAEDYHRRAEAFAEELAPVRDRLDTLAADGGGGRVAVTEPVPVYLLEAAGLENVTPGGFTEAIEEGTDVPVSAMEEMTTLVSSGSLAFLAYNNQTEGSQTELVRSVAEDADLPVLDFGETLPDGEDYVSWMSANTADIAAALES
ncbi:metal ABC transporter solute-binding protein, Zn/Mn family [uncultured Arthrobacter sp.]|uniref:metal ABC transporter solute-binding protein, Zn/Mn family n=1 Tax=uncultured Arthrobacter sp. TaxID=114050 RepID=UPI00262101AE|nr:zinc ABC transporter substrate-binding protein [uncultured Arthrobacter sp.]